MLQSVLLAAMYACLLFAGNSEAAIEPYLDDLPWLALRPKDLELPLNGKIYSAENIRLLNNKGEEIETLVQEEIVKYANLQAYEPKRGFVAGEEITIQPDNRDSEPFTVTIRSTVDEQVPAAPVLSPGESSADFKISGEGLFYINDDETGPIAVAQSLFSVARSPRKYRAIAVDEAGNQSLPSDWITAGKIVQPSPAGCSSTTGGSALSLLLLLAFRRVRYSR